MGVGGAVRRDLESEGEAVATFEQVCSDLRLLESEGEIILTFEQVCSDLRLLPRLEVTGELGRGEGLERFFSFLEMGSKNEFK